MRAAITLFIGFCLYVSGFAQPRNQHWLWHYDVHTLIGPSGPTLLQGPTVAGGLDGHASMSDTEGNLLFYHDSNGLRNADGGYLNGNWVLDNIDQPRTCIGLPRPEHPSQYYVVYTASTNNVGDPAVKWLGYVHVDMAADSGNGAILSPQFEILEDSMAFILAATPHANGSDYWALAHHLGNDEFRCYPISSTGPASAPVISHTGNVFSMSAYYPRDLRFSYGGDRVVMVNNGTWQLFDFNAQTGALTWLFTEPEMDMARSAEFSFMDRYLYVTDADSLNHIYQYDLLDPDAAAIMASKTSVFELLYIPLEQELLTHLRLAPDRRIYFHYEDVNNGASYLCAIDRPDSAGLACDVQFQMLDVAPASFFGPAAVNQCKRYHDSQNTVGVQEHLASATRELVLWPSPTNNGQVWFNPPSERKGSMLQVHDGNGRLIRSVPILGRGTQSLDVSGLASGTYTATLMVGAETIASGRLVIE
ncbi:MAG: T9SS type A sorting domain-containing protein [Flavobacteriales bacterium]|nr:T9SS type A sorting domain-containing protein [Flavobacteriales bacterium]MBK7085089.1 T9SS type A sorting domain-containing protein [Flavobacteriales bacterium]MBK9076696.1 T9SS type A sorting domain-containing protein [Flavobacteriales bacterium]MBK9538111.1 T9SS type A sorting domain-containing protein [Flavobacteriales bacterium]